MLKHAGFISGERIYLREVRISDVNENYYKWLNDKEVNQYLETRYIPQSLDNIKKYVENMDGKSDEIFLAICLNQNNKHIGNIKLGPINWIHRFATISFLIGEKKYWGNGFATEAITLVTKFAFNTLNLHKIEAGCYENNIGSRRSLEKVGFKVEGILKKHRVADGKFQNDIILGLCAEDINL
jgi:RimJ/RimL family protein N-acetyltransferase